MASEVILEVRDLRASFFTIRGEVKAVDGVSFDLARGETLCLVGESGCGKTATALAVLGLIQGLGGRILGGQARYRGEDLLTAPASRLRGLRGRALAMIFQDPQSCLNPVLTVGAQIMEPLRLHLRLSARQARARAVSLLQQVGIPLPERRLQDYPHQFSGGMKQRAMIAAALSCGPEVLVADEPTTALDVTTKAQILDLLKRLRQEREMSLIFISHDLGAVAELGGRVVVMYGGRMAETGDLEQVLRRPCHPYTVALLACIPDLGGDGRLKTIPGQPPSLIDPPQSCLLSPRCPYALPVCRRHRPELAEVAPGQQVACFLYPQVLARVV
ncbi:MAG: ABC transporter ATP-binding protein [Chloroflexi bacterium]|nr:ABC transporter ATP-binding protein [Chloroflexota bacterium]